MTVDMTLAPSDVARMRTVLSARYIVQPSGDEYVLIDRSGAIPGAPVYRTDNERKALDDCAKLNKAWDTMARINDDALASQGA